MAVDAQAHRYEPWRREHDPRHPFSASVAAIRSAYDGSRADSDTDIYADCGADSYAGSWPHSSAAPEREPRPHAAAPTEREPRPHTATPTDTEPLMGSGVRRLAARGTPPQKPWPPG